VFGASVVLRIQLCDNSQHLMRTQHHVDGRRVAAGKEEAEDSDDEINENLDVDAAADAFAAAAREKGFGNGSQHPGTSDFPYNYKHILPVENLHSTLL